jgi:hypothetical protein
MMMTVTPSTSSASVEGSKEWEGAGAVKSNAFIPAGMGPTVDGRETG